MNSSERVISEEELFWGAIYQIVKERGLPKLDRFFTDLTGLEHEEIKFSGFD